METSAPRIRKTYLQRAAVQHRTASLLSRVSQGELAEGEKLIKTPWLLRGLPTSLPCPSSEFESDMEVARDPSRPLAQRTEAFQGIIESEIGNTYFARARNLERELGLSQIYLKFEGINPTGTHKDRIAFAQVMDALQRGFEIVTVGTCGNYGAAITLACSMVGLRSVVYIPAKYEGERIEEMSLLGAEIVRVPGEYEDAVWASQERAARDGIYDANSGPANAPLQIEAYAPIADEMYDELGDAPAIVAGPLANGTTIAGIYSGFVSLYRRGRTSRIPKMVGGSSRGNNAITHSFMRKLAKCEDIPPSQLHESAVNEPLLNWHALDGDEALHAIRSSNGWAMETGDKQMLRYAKMIKDCEGLNVLPASVVGLIALMDRHHRKPLPNDRYVVVFTGKKF